MDVDCLKCTNSACCRLTVEMSRVDYDKIVLLGLANTVEKSTDKFIEKYPK